MHTLCVHPIYLMQDTCSMGSLLWLIFVLYEFVHNPDCNITKCIVITHMQSSIVIPHWILIHKGNFKTTHVCASVRLSVRRSVRPSICAESELRKYPMDLFHIWHHVRPISGGVARHFEILKKFKMADLWTFFCFFRTFLLVSQKLCAGSFSYLASS